MQSVTVIAQSPNKLNIMYQVLYKEDSISEAFTALIDEIWGKREHMERTIICRKYDECSELYTCIRRALGNKYTEPVGAPDLARFRLVDMYTACTSKSGYSQRVLQQ